MNSRQRKNGTSKALYRNAQASSSKSFQVLSHSNSLKHRKEEEEEESSQSSDGEGEEEDKNDDEDELEENSNADEISGDSVYDDSEIELPSPSGLVIRIPLKRMAPIADKLRTQKGRKLTHICIYLYVADQMYIGAKIPRRASARRTVEENQLEEPVVIVHEITYNLSIFSLEQLQKSTRSREAVARSSFVRLSSDLTWDDVLAKLKVKISDAHDVW
jgi:hypothetical protein